MRSVIVRAVAVYVALFVVVLSISALGNAQPSTAPYLGDLSAVLTVVLIVFTAVIVFILIAATIHFAWMLLLRRRGYIGRKTHV